VLNYGKYLIKGYYHAASMQALVIIPSIVISLFIFLSKRNKEKSFNTDEGCKALFEISTLIGVVILSFCFISAAEDANWLEPIKNLIPPLKGFSFQRAFVLNRPLWFILFTAVLLYLSKYRRLIFLIPLFIIGQAGYSMMYTGPYNDSSLTYARKIMKSIKDSNVTWNEFYDEDLFLQIKDDIDYQGEPVVAVGFHPFVLTYNHFNTIDAYLSYYPAEDAIKFRKLIAPELDVNEHAKKYYDSWPGRRYIYNKGLSYEPTRNKGVHPIELRIDMNVFINDYSGKYFISRAPFSNADILDLELCGHWSHNLSIYDMYVYKVK